MKYCTDDGKKVFDTEQEVFEYEAKVKAEKEAKTKLAKEKQNRRDEIKSDYKALMDKIQKYNKDYNEPMRFHGVSSTPTLDFFNDFLNSFWS